MDIAVWGALFVLGCVVQLIRQLRPKRLPSKRRLFAEVAVGGLAGLAGGLAVYLINPVPDPPQLALAAIGAAWLGAEFLDEQARKGEGGGKDG
jgi:peptidoglycan/LPS O-acetylase OafA/YrhL